jgi:hypothetical protein
MESTKVIVFKGKNIRKTIFKNEWWFVISDVVAVLSDSKDPSGYIKDMRRRDKELSKGWGQIATPLWIETPGGKQKVNCANTEGIFREELTDEWQQRGAREQKDYEILTAEISKAAFGLTPAEYKKLKGLKRENLRDHMDDFELIFTMLSERQLKFTELRIQKVSRN